MRNLFAVLVLMFPLVASAQAQTPPPVEVVPVGPPVEPVLAAVPVVQPVPAAAPVLNGWNVGAGIGFGVPFASADASAGLLGGNLGAPVTSTFGLSTQPRMTVLIERRLSGRLFLGFQLAASFKTSQSETFSAVSYRSVNFDGAVGLRSLFNPRGVVEVSWFVSAGVGYSNVENRGLVSSFDGSGMLTQTPQTYRGNAFAVGAVAGLTLERELISGLALRLSSSILGLGYSLSGATTIVRDVRTDSDNHGFDGGLRFSPTLELRYAF